MVRELSWILGASIAALVGCADITAARDAQNPASAGPGERTESARELGLSPGTKLTLERGIELALKINPSVGIARSRVGGAEARLVQTSAGILPQATVSAFLRYQDSETAPPAKSHGETISVNQLVFDFGKTNAAIRQAAQDVSAAQADLKSAENEAAFNFVQSFFNVLKQGELVRVSEETVRQFEKRLEQVKGFVEVGTRTKYDRTKAEVDLGNAQLGLVRARTALKINLSILNNALALAEDTDFTVQKPAADGTVPEAFDALVAQAKAQHPKLVAQRFREQGAIAAIDAAIADLAPQFTLQGSFGWSGSLTPITWNWLAGPLANWVLFSGGSKSGKIREQVAALREARAVRAQIEQQIFRDVRQAFSQIEDARERLKISKLVVQQAEENLQLVQGRYTAQKASSVELTDAQVSLANARGDLVQAEYDYQIALFALKRAVGTYR